MALMYRFLAGLSGKLMIGSLKKKGFLIKSLHYVSFFLNDSFRVQSKEKNKEEEQTNWMKVSNFTIILVTYKALEKPDLVNSPLDCTH